MDTGDPTRPNSNANANPNPRFGYHHHKRSRRVDIRESRDSLHSSLFSTPYDAVVLRIVALKSWNQENSGEITGTKRGYTHSITEDALYELEGLDQPDPPLLSYSLHQPSKQLS